MLPMNVIGRTTTNETEIQSQNLKKSLIQISMNFTILKNHAILFIFLLTFSAFTSLSKNLTNFLNVFYF